MAVARILSDGTADTTFGDGGLAEIGVGGAQVLGALAIQTDGKIVAAGTALKNFVVLRLLTNGAPDKMFGDGGVAVTDIGAFDVANSVAVLADGHILASGVTGASANNTDFAMLRYLSSGSLDPSFGNGGTVVTDFRGTNDTAGVMTPLPGGNILVVGGSYSPDGGPAGNFAVARFGPAGLLDNAFSDAGKLITTEAPTAFTGARSVVLESSGGYAIAGGRGGKFVVLRVEQSGLVDPLFGTMGMTTIDFGGSAAIATSVGLGPGGSLLAAGQVDFGASPGGVAVARLAANGALDMSFGNSGKTTTTLAPTYSLTGSASARSSCQLVVAGMVSDLGVGGSTYMGAWRYGL